MKITFEQLKKNLRDHVVKVNCDPGMCKEEIDDVCAVEFDEIDGMNDFEEVAIYIDGNGGFESHEVIEMIAFGIEMCCKAKSD